MKRSFLCAIALTAVLCSATRLWAKTFYLRDGSQIEYVRYWQSDGAVLVMVAPDTVIDYDADEVDLDKTSKAAAADNRASDKKHKKRAKALQPVRKDDRGERR